VCARKKWPAPRGEVRATGEETREPPRKEARYGCTIDDKFTDARSNLVEGSAHHHYEIGGAHVSVSTRHNSEWTFGAFKDFSPKLNQLHVIVRSAHRLPLLVLLGTVSDGGEAVALRKDVEEFVRDEWIYNSQRGGKA